LRRNKEDIMAIIPYDRRMEVRGKLDKILTENGYIDISSSPFLGQLLNSITSAVESKFDTIYDIADNIDIGRAEGSYLDRWGRFMNEPRSMLSFASDVSLANIYIYINPEDRIASEITNNVSGFSIPAGVTISNDDNSIEFETIDTVYMKADRSRVFCRIIAKRPGSIYLLAGQLTNVGISLTEIEGVLPSATSNYNLSANNLFSITGGEEIADDTTYQYMLQERSRAIGLFNEHTINSMMDITEIVNISIQEYTGGVNVYIETRRPNMSDIIVEITRAALRSKRLLGLSVNVYAPLYSTLKVTILLELVRSDNEGTTQSDFRLAVYETIIAQSMGSSIDITQICTDLKPDFPNIIGTRVKSASVNSRPMLNFVINQHFNEKITITEEDITIV
jgi:hypothetical protein